MRYLLDTCTLLWLANADYGKLSPVAQTIFQDSSNEIAVSTISLWELAMKAAAGKLTIPGKTVTGLVALCSLQYINILPVTHENIQAFLDIDPNHHDPFDRLIAAVSIHDASNPYVVISPDISFDAYNPFGVTRIW